MTPTFEQLGVWMACALIALDVYWRWKGARDAGRPQLREIQQPLQVQSAPQLMTKQECSVMHSAQDHRISALEAQLQEIRDEFQTGLKRLEDESRRSMDLLHKRVNDVLIAVSRLEGKMMAKDSE